MARKCSFGIYYGCKAGSPLVAPSQSDPYLAAPFVVPAPDFPIGRPAALVSSVPASEPVDPPLLEPWLLPDSIPDFELGRGDPVAEPESSFLPDFESVAPPGMVLVSAFAPCWVPVPVD
ncbi:MAG: hypothetical protein ICV76_00230 [Nitrospiraceae bacterium]|nr:hypothetical protein [Nitrospiraceae bacterium]